MGGVEGEVVLTARKRWKRMGGFQRQAGRLYKEEEESCYVDPYRSWTDEKIGQLQLTSA